MTKKILCIFLAIIMAISLFGCKKNKNVDEPTESVVATESVEAENNAQDTEPSTEANEITDDEDEISSESTVEIPTAPHAHDWTDTIKEPTCTEGGYTERVCEICGVKVQESATKPNGHEWSQWKVHKKATVTAEGEMRRNCTVCDDIEKKVIEKVDENSEAHTHKYTSKVTRKATCYQAGIETFTCECGDKYTENIAKTAHDYEETVVAPTCLIRGFTDHTCTVCQNNYRDTYVDVLPHDYGTKVVEATCVTGGYTTYKCKSCGDYYKGDEVASKGHNYKETVSSPTCTKDGYTTHTCINCNDSYVDSKVVAKGHDYKDTVVAATCTTGGYTSHKCNKCGDSYTDKNTSALGHNYKDTVTAPTCTSGGYTTHKCINCEKTYTDTKVSATGHKWSDWTVDKVATESTSGSKSRTCSVCNKKETQVISASEHSHSYTEVVTKPTCTSGGFTTYTCSSCGDVYTANKTTAVGHDYKSTVTAPSCTKNGYTTHKCSNCGDTYTDAKTVATGHKWSNWVVVKEPTETKEGLSQRTCDTCKDVETSTIEPLKPVTPPVEHTHSYKVTNTVNATCTSEGFYTETCDCGDERIIAVPVLEHKWEQHHEDEVGHYETRIVCHCGWSYSADGDYISAFAAHVDSVDPETRFDHSYYSSSTWVVDSPAKDWEQCSVCKTKK